MAGNDTSVSDFMSAALDQAKKAGERGEVPVGAVIVNAKTRQIVAAQGNRTLEHNDPVAHAEILAIREACQRAGRPRLEDHDLYVTLEPCAMCAAAISFARIRRLYFSAYDAKGGGVDHGAQIFRQATCHHAPDVYGGIAEYESSELLKTFFQARRL